ncbi:DUF11 domain-containing protein [Frigoriglobus tundricola]|uniref:DUF11 domain-containing protein n=1 Tax=Frigoriglobus tundricola TaxID=2774151 RepID=A0A6M5YK82_9BACT|nr:DUF11 domain-containing protein [Frigoriglobus tundricola]QJW93392.1 hypothetical protein FTUN_0898 [Frigoriglobus tundricola]
MSVWMHVRAAAVGGAAVAAAWAVVALAAPAQQPIPTPMPSLKFKIAPYFPNVPGAGEVKTASATQEGEKLPPIDTTIQDENVEPAQFKQPAGRQPAGTPPRAPASGPRQDVTDPPYPIVTIRVRVPADMVPGDDIKYVITVQNVSTADAHSVTVRNPLAAEVESVQKADPEPDKMLSVPAKQVVWALGTLKGGASKTLTLVLRHKANVTELKNLAYVKYEYGEAVTTKIAKPTIKVSKTAPKQTVQDEAFTVRVQIENTGKVAADHVRVVENLPASAQVEAVTAGGRKTPEKDGQQWEWGITKLQPGERKVIEYRVTAREAKAVLATTSIGGDRLVADRPAEVRTEVLVPGLELKLTGPPTSGPVKAGESAKYEITVRNTGTLPSTNVKVTGTLPADCKPTMKTDGGQVFRDSIVWKVPRLEPGEAQSFRFAIKANTPGRRVVVASASDARGIKAEQTVPTLFEGVAALVWETDFDTHTVQVSRKGMFTVKVKNHGGEAARNVRLQLDVPDEVTVVQMTPKTPINGSTLVFTTESIPAYGEETYTITFEGKKADQAWFKIRMTADCLGDRPMQTEKMVEVIGKPR